jgi:uncharacterized protein
MTRIFADSYFFMSLMNKGDAGHQMAVVIVDAVMGPIVTTQWVLVEVADAFCRPRDRALFKKLLELIDADKRIQVIPASDSQFVDGTQRYLDRPDKSWSLTDCISFVVMEDHHITEALTGDHHFEQAGFTALLKAP